MNRQLLNPRPSRSTCIKLFVILLVGLVLISVLLGNHLATPAQPRKDDETTQDKELKEAQIEYYRIQTEKMRRRSFYEHFTDEPAVIGAFVAALIALFSLVVNRRVTIRAQKD